MDDSISPLGSSAASQPTSAASPTAPSDKSKQAFESALLNAMNQHPLSSAGGTSDDDDDDDGSVLNVSMSNVPTI